MLSFEQILLKYISPNGARLVVKHLEEKPFFLKIVKPRKTKFGDYSYNRLSKFHKITINNDLGKDAFLHTLLHEIAHQHTTILHGEKVNPHGTEWKSIFRQLLLDAIKLNCFEKTDTILSSVNNIKSSSCYNPKLFETLYQKEDTQNGFKGVKLHELPLRDKFLFNSIRFQKIEVRRTRVLCLNLENNRQYTISSLAVVSPTPF